MNILELALQRIAVRKTEKLITKSFVYVSNQNSIPKHYKPEIPSIRKILKSILLFPLTALGAGVIFGLISIWSFNVSLIIALLIAIINVIGVAMIDKTFDRKSVPLQISDRRYKEGFRQEGYIDVIDPENFVVFTPAQRILAIIEAFIFSASLVLPLYVIHLIMVFEQQNP
jgi:hypothetical protein